MKKGETAMKYDYELRQVDALWYDDHWVWNESYFIEDVELDRKSVV